MTLTIRQNEVAWVQKFRPGTIAQCALPKQTRKDLEDFIRTGSLPNLLLSGPQGTGKTTTAMALCEQLGFEWIIVNGSNEGRLFETLRTKIANFATSVSFNGMRKVVIIDEADGIPGSVQDAMRAFYEEYSANCSFILTANFPNRLSDAIHSRCTHIQFSIPADEKLDIMKQMLGSVFEILTHEGVEFDKKAVASVLGKHFPDFRRTINELQRYGNGGAIDSGILASTTTNIDELVAALKAGKFGDMRQWVAKSPTLELTQLCRALYDRAIEVGMKKECIPDLVILLAKYQFQAGFCADKEINCVALLTEIMLNCEFE